MGARAGAWLLVDASRSSGLYRVSVPSYLFPTRRRTCIFPNSLRLELPRVCHIHESNDVMVFGKKSGRRRTNRKVFTLISCSTALSELPFCSPRRFVSFQH